MKDTNQGVGMDVGYGLDGSSAQVSYSGAGSYFMKDREVMRRTILRGKPVVSVADMCGVLRRKEGSRRPGMPKNLYQEVMQAAFKTYPIGRLENPGTATARVVFSAPPENDRDAKTKYHNMLVDVCQVSLREFTQALATRAPPGADDHDGGDEGHGEAAAAHDEVG
jgi:hypothetical protein